MAIKAKKFAAMVLAIVGLALQWPGLALSQPSGYTPPGDPSSLEASLLSAGAAMPVQPAPAAVPAAAAPQPAFAPIGQLSCLSASIATVGAKIETAWRKYYPAQVTSTLILFFPDESPAGAKARNTELRSLQTQLLAVKPTRVEDKIVWDKYNRLLQDRITAYDLKVETFLVPRWYEDYTITFPLYNFVNVVQGTPANRGGSALLQAYRDFPKYIDQWIAKMNSDTPGYYLQMDDDLVALRGQLTAWMGARAFYASPFANNPSAAPLVDGVMAAWRRIIDAYDETKSKRKVLRTLQNPSLLRLPNNGAKIYKWLQTYLLTTSSPKTSPDALFTLGKTLVAQNLQRGLQRYGQLANKPGASNVKDMINWILTSKVNNPYTTTGEVVDDFLRQGEKVEEVVTKEFGHLPRCPVTVRSCFDLDGNCGGGLAYYWGGRFQDGMCQAPGTFVVDFSPDGNPRTLQKSMLANVFLHEALPGHHVQTMLAQEADPSCTPNFFKDLSMNSYYGGQLLGSSEGWATYAASLGANLGVYQDPFADLGNIQTGLVYSSRLVIDAGYHRYNWTRQNCLDHFGANTAMTQAAMAFQCSRAAKLPASVPSYLVGAQAYKDARAFAENALGAKFDPRAYHKYILQYGDVIVDRIMDMAQTFVAAVRQGQKNPAPTFVAPGSQPSPASLSSPGAPIDPASAPGYFDTGIPKPPIVNRVGGGLGDIIV